MEELLIYVLGIAAYFLPTIICWEKPGYGGVFMLNLLLGWTGVGWIVALIWGAALKPERA